MKSLTLFSPAKINLFLEVLSKKSNGYHDLNSLMCICNVGDQIRLKKSDTLKLKINGPFSKQLKVHNGNIILYSLQKLEEISGLRFKLDLKLTKNLPISSGIGGGSSNAATIIKGVIKLFDVKTKSIRKSGRQKNDYIRRTLSIFQKKLKVQLVYVDHKGKIVYA